MGDKSQQNMFLALINICPNEVATLIDSIKLKNSSGHDGITRSWNFIILINKSLSTGIVPESLKIEKVTRIYKSKDKELFSNYRWILLLPTISKILEKITHKGLYNFLHNQFSTQANIWIPTKMLNHTSNTWICRWNN